MRRSIKKSLEEHIQRIFTMIDEQINLSVKKNESLPYYDLNEMIKLENDKCLSPLRISIKFKDAKNKYGKECDLEGNYFAMLWLYKHRGQLSDDKKKTDDKVLRTQLELFGLWREDYQELEEIDMDSIATIDAYTINKATREIYPLLF